MIEEVGGVPGDCHEDDQHAAKQRKPALRGPLLSTDSTERQAGRLELIVPGPWIGSRRIGTTISTISAVRKHSYEDARTRWRRLIWQWIMVII